MKGCLSSELPYDLVSAIQNVYAPAGIEVTTPPRREQDARACQYGACYLALNNYNVAFRVAKTTQDRPGQFVTLWKRSTVNDSIIPLDADDVNFIVISVNGQTSNGKCYQGQFIFNQAILIEKNIISMASARGKLAIRLFPPWSEELASEAMLAEQKGCGAIEKARRMSDSAKKTQKWQLKYFLPLKKDGSSDVQLVKKYFGLDGQL